MYWALWACAPSLPVLFHAVSFNASVDVERAEMDPLHTTASVEFFNVSVEKVQEFSASVEKSLFSRGPSWPFFYILSKKCLDVGRGPPLIIRQVYDVENPLECDGFSL